MTYSDPSAIGKLLVVFEHCGDQEFSYRDVARLFQCSVSSARTLVKTQLATGVFYHTQRRIKARSVNRYRIDLSALASRFGHDIDVPAMIHGTGALNPKKHDRRAEPASCQASSYQSSRDPLIAALFSCERVTAPADNR